MGPTRLREDVARQGGRERKPSELHQRKGARAAQQGAPSVPNVPASADRQPTQYVGESERAVRQVFARARASSPCIIFFDELDALVPRRDEALSESSSRVVNTLLTELDGLDSRRGVFVLGATNRPDMLDPAMCRPGRLDKLLYVDLPSSDERAEIVRTLLVRRRVPLAPSASPSARAPEDCVAEMVGSERCEGYSGADLAALVREAGVRALRRALGTLREMDEGPAGPETGTEGVVVLVEDFRAALDKVAPSVSKAQRRRYEALRETFASGVGGRRERKEHVV